MGFYVMMKCLNSSLHVFRLHWWWLPQSFFQFDTTTSCHFANTLITTEHLGLQSILTLRGTIKLTEESFSLMKSMLLLKADIHVVSQLMFFITCTDLDGYLTNKVNCNSHQNDFLFIFSQMVHSSYWETQILEIKRLWKSKW